MQIQRNIEVPTGNILVVDGELGNLEMLSIADYGKHVNLNQNKAVKNDTPLLPLSEKWVITISTQYGCSMDCLFCDVPKVGAGKNATIDDLFNQVRTGLLLHPEISSTKRLNIHYARMGEPSWNFAVIDSAIRMRKEVTQPLIGRSLVHPVISTAMPKRNKRLSEFINAWMDVKNDVYRGDAGLQLSINSTDENERKIMFSDNACSLEQISEIMQDIHPLGRKITLNFAVADYKVDPVKLAKLFNPIYFIVKLTPMHKTATALNNKIETIGDYTKPEPYQIIKNNLQSEGFDVLVFIASEDEDLGRITCGNAILSGTMPECKYEERTSCAPRQESVNSTAEDGSPNKASMPAEDGQHT